MRFATPFLAMFLLTTSEFYLIVDKQTQKFDSEHVTAHIWHPYEAAQTFEEAIQQLKTQISVVAEFRSCEPSLISDLDFVDPHYQRFDGDVVKSSVVLMADVEEKKVTVTLKVAIPAPWNAGIEQHCTHVFDVREQKIV
jgi:hypothetical protein